MNLTENNNRTINLFWTGGLDSTFRLIQCLITTNNLIQPHYIIRHEDSTGIEINTMIRIRRALVETYPEIRSRFLPTIYINEDSIPAFKDIDENITELRKRGKVAEQYQIMAHYCKAYNINRIEVALTRITGEKEFFNYFKDSPAFEKFTYPTIDLSKVDMMRLAKANKWDSILYMTSFCRRPKLQYKPCGVCGPCTDAVSAGMGFRFPVLSYVKARLLIPFRNFYRKNYLKHENSKFFRWIRRNFEHRF